MPDPVGLEPLPPGPSIYDLDFGTWAAWYERYRANTELVDWVKTDGQKTYALFTATHAVPLLRDYLDSVPQLLTPPEFTMAGYAKPTRVLPDPVESLIAPASDRGQASIVPLLLVACFVLAAVRRRLPESRALFLVGLSMILLSALGSLLTWWGSAVELIRHAVPFSTFLLLGLIVLLLAWADTSGPGRRSPRHLTGDRSP
jgi:hypothetical protein